MLEPRPIAILASGSGSNLQALLDAEAAGSLGCRTSVVITDRPGIRALERANEAGVPTEVVDWESFRDREGFSSAICDVADRHGADGMVLAGFMRILSPVAVERFPNRIINVHPALLPAFPGAHAVRMALDHGVTITGVTVHFVDEQVDHGPIIAQEAVPVLPGDDEASLHARIQAVEHRLLPEVVAAFGRGELEVTGRHVTWRSPVTQTEVLS